MKKKLLSMICAICTICMLVPMTISAETYGRTENGLSYTISNTGEVTITGYTGTDDVVIPSIIEEKTVTAIAQNAFKKTNITSVEIPESVKNIGDNAFMLCSYLSKVTIKNGVGSIGNAAFQYCSSLTNISIPASVTFIDNTAFNGCTSLINIQVDDSNANYSSQNGILFNKNQTELIRYPQGKIEISYSIPGTVTSIGNYAFFCCDILTNITIPNSVTSIGVFAFGNCAFESITIPNSVTTIKESAFNNCPNMKNITFVANSQLTSIGSSAFSKCNALESINIPYGVTSISNRTFQYCSNLTSVTIPKSVTAIGKESFENCINITNIDIPNGVTSIGIRSFSQTKLTSIVIPYSVTSIEAYAFFGCTNLTSIFLPDKDDLSIDGGAIPDTTTQVKYSLNNNEVTITEIKLGSDKTKVDIPDKICGYPVVAVADAYQQYVDTTNHTCKYYVETNNDSQYWKECTICGKEKEGTRKDLPVITINAPDQVCRTQDAVVSVSLPEGFTDAALYHEFSHSGSEIDLDAKDGLNGQVSHESYPGEDNSLKFVVYATTSDGYKFTVTKTVQILDNHDLKHISAKDATVTEEGNKEYWQCTVCEKYFSDENGTNEISFEDTIISKLAPEIIDGKGQSVTQGEKKALSFTSNALFNEFKYVKLDGKELDSSKYTVKSGSIVVTLKSDFVSTLKVGKHTISIVSESGEATTEFEVVKKETVKDTSKKENSNKTNTGIIENAGLWISMMISSLDALLIGLVLKRKKCK